jgi:hypothetical protein
MSRKILSCIMCLSFFFISLYTADYKPHAQKRIESWNQLLNEVKQTKEEQNKPRVNFDLPSRKGPAIDGNPDQRKNVNNDKNKNS